MKDKERASQPQEISSDDLEVLLQEDSTQSSVILAKLHVNQSTVIQRLHKMDKIIKEEK